MTTLKRVLQSAVKSLTENIILNVTEKLAVNYVVKDQAYPIKGQDKIVKGDYTPVVKMRRSRLKDEQILSGSGLHSDFVVHAHLDKDVGRKKAASLLCGAKLPKFAFSAEYSADVSCPKCQEKLKVLGLKKSALLKLYGEGKDSTVLDDVHFCYYSP